MSPFTHFLITRFSYRQRSDSLVNQWYRPDPPLDHERLERRFELFEIFALPTVREQSCKNFRWIIIVDPQLNSKYRQRLQQLTAPVPQTTILNYDPAVDIGGLKWLSPFIDRDVKHVITSNVDDDDAGFPGLAQHIQQHALDLLESGKIPSCTLMGCMNITQWDYMPTKDAPLGYKKPWHRPAWPSSAWYTLCCKYPEYDLSVLSFNHVAAYKYFDPEIDLDDRTFKRIRRDAEAAGENWRNWQPKERFHGITTPAPQIVMSNHIFNDQAFRVFEGWKNRTPIRNSDDFPNICIDFDKARRYATHFGRNFSSLVRLFWAAKALIERRWILRKIPRFVALPLLVVLVPWWFTKGKTEPSVRAGKYTVG